MQVFDAFEWYLCVRIQHDINLLIAHLEKQEAIAIETPAPTQPQPQATNSTASFDSKNVAKEIIVDNDLGCVRVIE